MAWRSILGRSATLAFAGCLVVQQTLASVAPLVLDIQPGERLLLEFIQQGADFAVVVDSPDEHYEVNHPLRNTGPELLLIGPFPTSTQVQLQFNVLDGEMLANPIMRSSVIDANDPALPAYMALTTAGRQFALHTAASVHQAQALYHSINVAGLPAKWRYLPSYLAAETDYFLFDLPAAQQALGTWSSSECAVPDFCYKDDLLRAELPFALDQYSVGAPLFTKVIDDIEKHPEADRYAADLALATVELGVIQAVAADRPQALSSIERALRLAKRLESDLLLGESYNALATYYVTGDKPDLHEAVQHLLTAMRHLEHSQYPRAYIYAAQNLSSAYNYLGEFSKSQQTSLASLSIAEVSGDDSLLIGVYADLVATALRLGDWEPAEAFARKIIGMEVASGREMRQHLARLNLGTALRQKGLINEAVQQHEIALRHFESTGDKASTAVALRQLGLDAVADHRHSDAHRYYDRITAAIGTIDTAWLPQRQRLLDSAQLALSERNPEFAIGLLIPEWERLVGSDEDISRQIEMAGLLMMAFAAKNDFMATDFYGDRLVELARDMRGQLEQVRLGAAWSASINHYFKNYAANLVSRYQDNGDAELLSRALEVLEQSRAQNLLAFSSAKANGRSNESSNEQIRQRLAEVANRRASTQIGTPDFVSYSTEYYQLLAQLQNDGQPSVQHRAGSGSTLERLPQTVLRNEQALVEFLCLRGSTCGAIIVSKKVTTYFDMGTFDDLAALAESLSTVVRVPGETSNSLRLSLGTKLFAEFSKDPRFAEVTHLLLVEDSPLTNVPMAALLLDESTTLGARFQLTQVPSFAAYDPQNQEHHDHAIGMAVFADPEFSGSTVRPGEVASRHFTGWVESLSELRWSRAEAEHLRELFTDDGVKLYLGGDATRANLLSEEARTARILHIATHAYFNQGMQDLVGFALSSGEPNGTGDFLSMHDLLQWELHAELVVISGCETALGMYVPGEGNQSLAQGFIRQGANHVISTLWPVSDRASVEFMRIFYTALHENGGDISLALQSAQLELARNPVFSDPFYWAPYLLTSVR